MLILGNQMKKRAVDFFREQYEVISAQYMENVVEELIRDMPEGISLIVLALYVSEDQRIKLLKKLQRKAEMRYIPLMVILNVMDEKIWEGLTYCGINDVFVITEKKNVSNSTALEVLGKRISNMIFAEQYKKQEFYDLLTGALNRRGFCIRAEDILKKNPEKEYIMIISDIERFKVINDLFGLEIGNSLLCEIAEASSKTFYNMQLFGRWESDRFVYLVEKKNFNIEQIEKACEVIISYSDIHYHVVNRFGMYEIHDLDMPIDFMVNSANMALKTTVGSHLQRYAFYEESMRDVVLEEQIILNEMEYALEQGQFEVYYQPIFDAYSEKPVSAEALVRWIHPEKGMLNPGTFIPVFEKNGFITKLDAFVKEQVCRFIKKSEQSGMKMVPISVNISRSSFYHSGVYGHIMELIQKYGIDVSSFRVEVTESAYTDNAGRLLNTVNKLQENGIKILMDDFGSGYSSLNMLKALPVDYLKLDMSFMEDLENDKRTESIMESIVQMAKKLNMTIIAEGVETKAQLEFLKSIGCDLIQGYYFSCPVDKEAFLKVLKDKVL